MTLTSTAVSPAVARARDFLLTHARILERRLAGLWFGEAAVSSAIGVFDALDAYRNDDGGLGHGLEPDVRAPGSQPLAADFALDVAEQVLHSDAGGSPAVRERAATFATGLLPFLASAAESGGALPLVLPSMTAAPRAAHWGDGGIPAGINPTGGIVARLRLLGASSPWLDRAESYCRTEIDRVVGEGRLDGHTVANVLRFLEYAPDRAWADGHTAAVAERFADLDFFHLYPARGYGLTPIDLAPLPGDRLRALFPADAVEAHLDALAAAQDEDGGWPVAWEPPGPAATLEWRGVVTVKAARALAAAGR